MCQYRESQVTCVFSKSYTPQLLLKVCWSASCIAFQTVGRTGTLISICAERINTRLETVAKEMNLLVLQVPYIKFTNMSLSASQDE